VLRWSPQQISAELVALHPDRPEMRVLQETIYILGANCRSAIGTLVERSNRYVMLLHLSDAHDAVTVRDRLIPLIQTLPGHLRRSLTWDRGTELARHQDITLATDMAIYFCDPTHPGSAGRMRTPTACCANISRRAATSPCTPPRTWSQSPLN